MDECRLCRQAATLKKSHLIPKAVYKLVRDVDGKNRNPIFATKDGAATTSSQVWEYLLCGECEGRFSECGERHVVPKLHQLNGEFGLRDSLEKMSPVYTRKDSDVYDDLQANGIDIGKHVYFSASVFWRAAVQSWHAPSGGQIKIYLGPYLERLRTFLLGEAEFPSKMSLMMSVWTGSFCVIEFPRSGKPKGFHVHAFTVPGITYYLCAGQRISDDVMANSISSLDNPRLVLADFKETNHFRNLARMTAAAPPKGSLGKTES